MTENLSPLTKEFLQVYLNEMMENPVSEPDPDVYLVDFMVQKCEMMRKEMGDFMVSLSGE
jgi:hypothetical protein